MNAMHKGEIAGKSWHSLDEADLLRVFKANKAQGLSAHQIKFLQEKYGPNLVANEEKTTWYKVFLRQFFDVLIMILFFAGLVSIFLGEETNAIAIFGIIILNSILGFTQEWKAEKALEALQNMLAPSCKVIREGNIIIIPSSELVPGDLVLLEAGDRIPADLRILEAINLKADESLLTGESIAVEKNSDLLKADVPISGRSNMLWMGTSLTNGRGRGLVVASGPKTEFGKIASLTQNIKRDPTPLQKQLAVLGKQLGIFAIAISILISVSGWFMGKPLLEMFMTGISLAVAIVPEGLPAVVTITLALGIRTMVKKKALLRRLQAAEALGTATVICTDKTGTLTQNQMTVQKIFHLDRSFEVTGVGYKPEGSILSEGQAVNLKEDLTLMKLLTTAELCNNSDVVEKEGAWESRGEATEASLKTLVKKSSYTLAAYENLREISFNSDRKRMSVIVKSDNSSILLCKGAPEVLLSLGSQVYENGKPCNLTPERLAALENACEEFANQGLRTLCFADKEVTGDEQQNEDQLEADLRIIGIVGIADPPRPEVPEAIAAAKNAGIRIMMITGDSKKTAKAIGARVGLNTNQHLLGKDIDRCSDEELSELLHSEVIFSRTTPEHKLRIVSLLQKQGEVTAMTGDGVNDAPALRKADIGIAMGLRGTDVAKGASDMVLTDDNFASIINAIREGRRQYENIKKFVCYLLTSNLGELLAIFLNILLGGPLILLPVQILWVNLVTDGLTSIALGLEPDEKDVMNQKPRKQREPIVNKPNLISISLVGGYIGIVCLLLFHYQLKKEDYEVAQTMAFCFLVSCENLAVLNFRSLRTPIYKLDFFSNPWLLAALSGTILIQFAAVSFTFLQKGLHTVSLSLEHWVIIFSLSLPILIIPEIYKMIRKDPNSSNAHSANSPAF